MAIAIHLIFLFDANVTEAAPIITSAAPSEKLAVAVKHINPDPLVYVLSGRPRYTV